MAQESVLVHTACGGTVTVPMDFISRSTLLKDVVESIVEPGGVVMVPAAEQVVRNWVACASMLQTDDDSSNTRELTSTLVIWLEVRPGDMCWLLFCFASRCGSLMWRLLAWYFGVSASSGLPCAFQNSEQRDVWEIVNLKTGRKAHGRRL